MFNEDRRSLMGLNEPISGESAADPKAIAAERLLAEVRDLQRTVRALLTLNRRPAQPVAFAR